MGIKEQAEELGITVDNRWSNETLQAKIDEAKAKQDADRAPVDTSQAKVVPNIGQPRAQTTEEMRQDQQADTSANQAGPYPRDPNEANADAVAASERQKDAPEFDTKDLQGTSVNGEGKTDTVTVRLLYDWWDGSGVRHPLNSEVEMPINDARNLVDQRKAERTDAL